MEKKKKGAVIGAERSGRAAADFLRAGRRNELAREGGFDLHSRFSQMSDEDFDKGVADGSITPEQIRKAGEYAYDTHLGDVWSEMDDNDLQPEPSYEEFMANPEKYGYNPESGDNMHRYNPARYNKK